MILLKSMVGASLGFLLSIVFVWKDIGIVDLLASVTNYNRYLLLLILGRSILWTLFMILFRILLVSPAQGRPSSSNAYVTKIIKPLCCHLSLELIGLVVTSITYLVPVYESTYTEDSLYDGNGVLSNEVSGYNNTMNSTNSGVEEEVNPFDVKWRWEDHPNARKAIVLLTYAFCDYIAISLSTSVLHLKPSLRVLGKQLRFNALQCGWYGVGSLQ